jgi:hypothetical protein
LQPCHQFCSEALRRGRRQGGRKDAAGSRCTECPLSDVNEVIAGRIISLAEEANVTPNGFVKRRFRRSAVKRCLKRSASWNVCLADNLSCGLTRFVVLAAADFL